MPPAASVKSTIFVGGLSQAVTVRTLQDAFVPFGEIADIKLPKPDHPSAKEPHRGFAYIKFEEEADASEAVDNMDRSELYGRILKVAAAKPQRENNEGLNSKTAIWHQVRPFPFSLRLNLLIFHRRVTWPSTPSHKRTVMRFLLVRQKTQCKVSRVSTRLGPKLSERPTAEHPCIMTGTMTIREFGHRQGRKVRALSRA